MAPDDAARAWQLLLRLFFAQRAPVRGAVAGLSPVQCHVLHLLEPDRPVAMKELAATLSCDASNVTGLIDRLEARGLIRRRPSAADRRVKQLELTPAGCRCRSQLVKRTQHAAVPLSRLSETDRRALIRLLEALLDDGRPGGR
jgi:DNA-binding MarR family transcriptional regulator